MSTGLRVERLSTTPVKGLTLHHPASVELTREGVPDDRRFLLVDETGAVQSCTRNPDLFGLVASYDTDDDVLEVRRGDAVVHRGSAAATGGRVDVDFWGQRTCVADVLGDPTWSELFSDLVGKPVRVLRARTAAYDVQPATLLGLESVRRLTDVASGPVDARRFRMLIEFSGGTPHLEDTWDGSLLRVGGAVVRGGGGVHRCAATTRDPDSGVVDLQTLRLIASYRGRQPSVFGLGSNFGVYAEVVEPGTVAVGDEITVEA